MGGMLHHPSFFLLLPPYLDDPNNLSLVKGFIGGVVWAMCVPPLPTPVPFFTLWTQIVQKCFGYIFSEI